MASLSIHGPSSVKTRVVCRALSRSRLANLLRFEQIPRLDLTRGDNSRRGWSVNLTAFQLWSQY
jgi:hypothetical protein